MICTSKEIDKQPSVGAIVPEPNNPNLINSSKKSGLLVPAGNKKKTLSPLDLAIYHYSASLNIYYFPQVHFKSQTIRVAGASVPAHQFFKHT